MGIHGESTGSLWTLEEQPVGIPWAPHRQPHPADSPWTSLGQSMGIPRAVHGQSMGIPRAARGQPMACPRTAHGYSTGSPWAVRGQATGSP